MKMIPKQAIRRSLCNGICVSPPEFHEIGIVLLLDKNVFAVIATIVNMVILSKFKGSGVTHDLIIKYYRDLTGLTNAVTVLTSCVDKGASLSGAREDLSGLGFFPDVRGRGAGSEYIVRP
jgi:hypothetical protein